MPAEITFKNGDITLRGTLFDVSDIGVILCPPHPLMGGSRHDARIVNLANELSDQGISALCMDYGEYGKGISEIRDVLSAISFMKQTKKDIGVLGYSFGAVVSSNAVSKTPEEIKGFVTMSILRKVDKINADLTSKCKKLMINGKRDLIVPHMEFEKLFSEANGEKECLVLDTDHFYGGVMDVLGKRVCEFFNGVLKVE